MTALDRMKEITEFLRGLGIDDAHKESEIIVTHCLGIDKASLYRDNPVLSERDVKEDRCCSSAQGSQRAAAVYHWPCGILRLEDKGWAGHPYSKA